MTDAAELVKLREFFYEHIRLVPKEPDEFSRAADMFDDLTLTWKVKPESLDAFLAAIAAQQDVREAAIEECAKIAEDSAWGEEGENGAGYDSACETIAIRLRELKQVSRDEHLTRKNLMSDLQQSGLELTWQPIETAPPDQIVLLGWWRRFVGMPDEWVQEVREASNTKGGWLHGQATHWQLLPSPPQSSWREE